MLFLLGFLAVFSLCYSEKTFGDVSTCTSESYGTCKTYCQKWHPNYKDWNKVQKCFEDRRKEFLSCMQTQGVQISDATPCYPITTSKRRSGDSRVTQEIPNPAKCYKRCLKRAHKRCRKDCTGQPDANGSDRKSKRGECKNDDQILDCLESEDTGSSNQNTPNFSESTTSSFAPL